MNGTYLDSSSYPTSKNSYHYSVYTHFSQVLIPSGFSLTVFYTNIINPTYGICPTHTDFITLITVTLAGEQHRSCSSSSHSFLQPYPLPTSELQILNPALCFQTPLSHNRNWMSRHNKLYTALHRIQQTRPFGTVQMKFKILFQEITLKFKQHENYEAGI
jgi:hypothetical protein